MCLVTIGVTSSKGVRAAIHNGFWFFKILVMAALIITIFVIPISHLDQVPLGVIQGVNRHTCPLGSQIVCFWVFFQAWVIFRVPHVIAQKMSLAPAAVSIFSTALVWLDRIDVGAGGTGLRA